MGIAANYAELVQWIRNNTDMSDTVLHIHAGMAVLVLARLATRYPLSHPVPLMVVVTIAVVNEVLNRLAWGSWRLHDTMMDFSYSIFWPVVLFATLALGQRHATKRERQLAGQRR